MEHHARRASLTRATALALGSLLGVSAGLGAALLTSSSAVTGSGASAVSSVLLGRPVQPLPGPGGGPSRGPLNQFETSNWSGYAVAHFETNTNYTAASGTWVVPSVSLPTGYTLGYSSSWVGIGGFCQNASCSTVDSTLIQLGTDQNVTSSGTSYSAWYELLPSGPVTIPLSISSGDTITASLADGPSTTVVHGSSKPGHGGGSGGGNGGGGGSGQSWTLSMTVTTQTGSSASWTTTVSYNSSLASAEWIEEAPVGCIGRHCQLLPLADYGTATFDPGTANGVDPALVAADAIVMVNSNGETSNPSSPDGDTDGFDTCWGPGTSLSPCSPPAS